MKMLGIMKNLLLVYIALMVTLMLVGCNLRQNTIVQTNNFRQTNYYTDECYVGHKTFSEIILCLENKSKSEIVQNNATNEMLDKIND